tara:strand:- start:43556 stop:43798 length:243 start_codon:yes stop_codon:yes gene_type:complete
MDKMSEAVRIYLPKINWDEIDMHETSDEEGAQVLLEHYTKDEIEEAFVKIESFMHSGGGSTIDLSLEYDEDAPSLEVKCE